MKMEVWSLNLRSPDVKLTLVKDEPGVAVFPWCKPKS